MAIELPCPGCGQTLRVGDEHAGKQARCPQCQTVTSVPAAAGSSDVPFGGAMPSSSGATSPPQAKSPLPSQGAAGGGMWQMKTPEGQVYGPVSWHDLQGWLKDGRIGADCQLLQQGSTEWKWASAVIPSLSGPKPIGSGDNPFAMSSDESRERHGTGNPYQSPRAPGSPINMRRGGAPHRGGLVLTLGILGILFCGIFTGIPAWVMGAHDLAEIKAGRMDSSGQGITQAGMILGIVSVVFSAIGCFIGCLAGLAGA